MVAVMSHIAEIPAKSASDCDRCADDFIAKYFIFTSWLNFEKIHFQMFIFFQKLCKIS